MKCPKCGKEGCKYINRGSKVFKVSYSSKERTKMVALNEEAKCKHCGWKGEI